MSSTLVARRLGRITFGGVLVAGLAYLMSHGGASMLTSGCDRPMDAALILAAIWAAAFAANLVVRVLATRLALRDPLGRHFVASVVVPAVGIALLLPITLHMPVALVIAGSDGFDAWFQISVMITGFAHIVFALMVAVRGYQLATTGATSWSPRLIYALTIVTSCIPFVVLWTIPPILVGLTAMPFLPMLRAMERMVSEERWEMQSGPEMLPEARMI